MQAIKFKSGTKTLLIATRTFTMGNPPIQIRKGTEVMYDGSQAEIDGETYSLPGLRGACRPEVGWLVAAEDYDEDAPVVRVSANMQMRHATQGGNPLGTPEKTTVATVASDERVVGSTADAAQSTRDRNASYHTQGQKVRAPNGATIEVEQQDGIPVRQLKTKAKSNPILDGNNAGALMSQANSVTIDPGKGITEDEYLARMSEEDQEKYKAVKSMHRSAYVSEDEPTRKPVSKVKKSATTVQDGITVSVSTGGGIETIDLSDSTAKAETHDVYEGGIKFSTTNGPKRTGLEPTKPAANLDTRRMIAKAMCSDFPDNYNFAVPAKKRVARLQADYEDRPDVIRAAFAAETDDVKAILEQEFPQAFSS